MSYHSNLSLLGTYRTTAADEDRRMARTVDGAALSARPAEVAVVLYHDGTTDPIYAATATGDGFIPALAGAPAGAVIIETTPASPSLPSASQEGAVPLSTPRQP